MTMTNPMIGEPIKILFVEDNPADVRLTLEALQEFKLRNEIYVVGDGEEAMAFLRHSGPHAQSPRPDLILLDLNLPKKDGREVLAEVKSDPDLKSIPVVVLTISEAEKDVSFLSELHADGYLSKPVDLKQFVSIVNFVDDFWLAIVKAPGMEPQANEPDERRNQKTES